jgi:hypothetical protein
MEEAKKRGRPSKKDLVEKVAAETGLSEKKLERLPIAGLEKLDELVPDAVEEEIIDIAPVVHKGPKGKLVGHHPITKEPVYI